MQPLTLGVSGALGREAELHAEIGSTNERAHEVAHARDLAADPMAAHGLAIIAHAQTHGRGRQGRTWASPPSGNLYMSVVLRPAPLGLLGKDASHAGLITLAGGMAAAEAIADLTGVTVGLKWPNDLMVGGRKLGGLLVEARFMGNELLYIVFGIGINLGAREADFPEDVRAIATSVAMLTGHTIEPEAAAAAVLDAMDAEMRALASRAGRAGLVRRFRGICSTIGQRVAADRWGVRIKGVAVEVDTSGGLVIELKDGERITLASGDVHLL